MSLRDRPGGAAALPSRARTLSFGLASFLIVLAGSVAVYSWAV